MSLVSLPRSGGCFEIDNDMWRKDGNTDESRFKGDHGVTVPRQTHTN